MKVLDRKEWSYTFSCKGCGSRLQADSGDVRYADLGCGYGGDSDYQFFVKCEVCGNAHRLGAMQLPANVIASARKR